MGIEKFDFGPMLGSREVLFFSTAFVFIYTQLFYLPFTPIYFDGDNLISVSNAMRMLNGEVMYRDFFHITPPGAEVVYAFLFRIFGVKVWVLNMTIVFLGLAQVWLIWFFSRKILTGASVYLPAAIFLVIGFRQFGIDGTYRLFSVIFVLIAVAALMDRRSLRNLVFAGCLCGIGSFFVQTRGILGIAGISAFLLWENYRNGFNFRLLVKNGLTLVVSFIVTVILTQSYFLWQAGVDNYYFAIVEFIQKHYKHEPLAQITVYLSDVPSLQDSSGSNSFAGFSGFVRGAPSHIFYYLLIPLVYVVFLFTWWRRKNYLSDIDAYSKILLLCMVGIFLAIGVSAPTAQRFYQVAIPGVVILVWLIQKSPKFNRLIPVGLILLSLIGGAYIVQRQMITKQFLNMPAGYVAFLHEPTFQKYEWVRSHTEPGEIVYEPRHPSFYFPFHLRNPTPMYLVRDSEYTPAFQIDSVVKTLEKSRPRLIIWPKNWSKSLESRTPDDHLEPLWQFINSNYEIKHVFINDDPMTLSMYGNDEILERKH